MKKRCPVNPHWWQIPRVVAGWVAGIVAVGAVATFLATHIGLPNRVEAGEMINEQQDDAIKRLIWLQERYEERGWGEAPTPVFRETDAEDVMWCCDLPDRKTCWQEYGWYRC